MTEDMLLFFTVICHQPYSELKNIPIPVAFGMFNRAAEIVTSALAKIGEFQKGLKNKPKSEREKNSFIPDVPPLSELMKNEHGKSNRSLGESSG